MRRLECIAEQVREEDADDDADINAEIVWIRFRGVTRSPTTIATAASMTPTKTT